MLNLLQQPNVVLGQAVCSSALPQQRELPERWLAVVFIAFGNEGRGPRRRAANVLDPKFLGTHSLRRTKATLIYRRTGNLRAIQLLLGHRKIESTARYLGIEVDDALAIAEQVDI